MTDGADPAHPDSHAETSTSVEPSPDDRTLSSAEAATIALTAIAAVVAIAVSFASRPAWVLSCTSVLTILAIGCVLATISKRFKQAVRSGLPRIAPHAVLILWIATGALTVATITLLNVTYEDPTTSTKTVASTGSADTPDQTGSDEQISARLTVPDETGRCENAALILAPGQSKDDPKPGRFAITPGTQVSVVLQAADRREVLVQRVRTVVDSRSAQSFSGDHVDITPGCQGAPDKRYYLADFSTSPADVRPREAAAASELPPLTVSSDDTVVIYLVVPSVAGTVRWHIELTTVSGGTEHIVPVTLDGQPVFTSS